MQLPPWRYRDGSPLDPDALLGVTETLLGDKIRLDTASKFISLLAGSQAVLREHAMDVDAATLGGLLDDQSSMLERLGMLFLPKGFLHAVDQPQLFIAKVSPILGRYVVYRLTAGI